MTVIAPAKSTVEPHSKVEMPAHPAQRRKRGRPPSDPHLRKLRILNAAAELFSEKGYASTGIAEISRKAEVTEHAIYDLIGDKEQLFRAVCEELCTRASAFNFDMPLHDMPIRTILESLACKLLEYAKHPSTIAFNRTVANAGMHFPDLVISVIEAGKTILNSAIAAIFQDLIDQGRMPPKSTNDVADIFYDIIVGNKPLRMVMSYPEPSLTTAQLQMRLDIAIKGFCLTDVR